ncbi:DoxX family protein [Paenibacillus sp. WLX2291]|uniref:DoxX family protein n=1 Tax=Paenibacillus sp. WLX2291 TaxID=3296934 RepID=UPI003984007D
MTIVSIVLQILLGLGFIMFGSMKFGSKQMVDEFQRYGYGSGFRLFTGLVEMIAAVLLLWGIWNGVAAVAGSLLVIGTMLGGILTHIKIKDPGSKLGMPIILLVLGIVVLLLNINAVI